MRKAAGHVLEYVLRLLEDERRAQGKTDANRQKEAEEAISRAGAKAKQEYKEHEVEEVARRFGRRTDDFNRQQLDRQVRAALSVPLSAVERPIVDKLDVFAKENAQLISTVPTRYFERIQARVRDAFESGISIDELTGQLQDVDGMADNDARRIARDQIGKLNGQFNEERQTAMGVTGYTWETAQDERVRDEHAERQNQHFEWDDPPEDGHPGEAVQCRCFASPDFTPILEEASEEG